MRRVRAIVSGRVQGVSFRAFTIREAEALGLTGWVRNLGDGTVELEAQGDDAKVRALLAWCARGSPAARVTGVATSDRPVVHGEPDFALR